MKRKVSTISTFLLITIFATAASSFTFAGIEKDSVKEVNHKVNFTPEVTSEELTIPDFTDELSAELITVMVFNQEGNVVHKQTITHDDLFSLNYNLSTLPKEANFLLTFENKAYYYINE